MSKISLEELEPRPDRCTRVAVSLEFEDANTMTVTVRDLGFGEFYPAKDTVIRESIRLS